MRGNTVTIELPLKRGKVSKTIPLYQFDYGQKLIITGAELPEYYEVHFANEMHGDAITSIGDETGVQIPDSMLTAGDPVYLWLFLHETGTDGETEFQGVIPVIKRARVSDQEPTPEEQSAITEAIAALNAAVGRVEAVEETIEDMSVSATTLEEGESATVTKTVDPVTGDVSLEFGIPVGATGEPGEDGDPGQDGVSPTVAVSTISGGHRVTITDATSTNTFDVMDGVDGTDGQDGTDGTDGVDATPALITTLYADLTFPVTVGTMCSYNGLLYKANTAIQSSEEWTAAHWTQTTIEAELSSQLTEIVNRPEVAESTKTGVDLDVSDANGNVIARLKDGHIQTKGFDSSQINMMFTGSNATADMDISDVNGNVVMRLENGHVKTKNFESNHIRQLMGKKWVVIGDSLTEHNTRATMNYHDYIAEETGIAVVNLGRSGRGYAKESNGMNFSGVVANIPNDVDVITIFGSGNDNSSGLDLGTATDSSTTTICGCINATLDAIFASFPLVPLGIITPTPWENSEPSDGVTAMSNYSAKIVEICALRGIPCLDLYHCSNLHPDDDDFRDIAYSRDEGNGVHPDENGHKFIAPRFRQFLFSLI